MRRLSVSAAVACLAWGLSACGGGSDTPTLVAVGDTIIVTESNQVASFNRATPGTQIGTRAIIGLQAGETVSGIDFRPASGLLYALGSRGNLYTLDAATGRVIGSSSYHDIVPAVERLEIGYTWYGASHQRSAVNTTAKWLLMHHAFETLGAQLVGWRTDNYNFASQRAIERLGARKDGVLRHHALRRDGTVRDTVMYSLAAGEWPEVKAHLLWQLTRPR